MTGYEGSAAAFYDLHYGHVAEKAGRQILDFVQRQVSANGVVIDVCCGTGQMANIFAEAGFQVVGIDLSADMLSRARQRTAPLGKEDVCLIQGDATRIPVADNQADVVVCSTDSVNHLPSMDHVREFVASTARALRPGGWLILDLLTPTGFADRNGVHVLVNGSAVAVVREIYDEELGRSMSRVTAFSREQSGLYRRMDMNANRLVIDPFKLVDNLVSASFTEALVSWPDSLGTPIDCENDLHSGDERVYVLARL